MKQVERQESHLGNRLKIGMVSAYRWIRHRHVMFLSMSRHFLHGRRTDASIDKRQIHVLAHIARFPPYSIGGAQLSMQETVRFLSRHGCRVVVLTPLAHGSSRTEDYIVLGETRSTTRHAYRWADVVLTQLPYRNRAIRVAAKYGVPVVHFIRGPGQLPTFGTAELLVFNANWIAEQEGAEYPHTVLHPPVYAPTEQANYRHEQRQYVTLINLSKEKGGDLIWKLALSMPCTRFLGVEGQSGRQQLNPLENLEIRRSTPDIDVIYAITRILLMPTVSEPFGRVALEAALRGIPVIAHPSNGAREVLGNAGIYVERCDLRGWINAIKDLQQDEAYYARTAQNVMNQVRKFDPTEELAVLHHRLNQIVLSSKSVNSDSVS